MKDIILRLMITVYRKTDKETGDRCAVWGNVVTRDSASAGWAEGSGGEGKTGRQIADLDVWAGAARPVREAAQAEIATNLGPSS